MRTYDNGLQYPFLKTKKIVLQVEHDFKDEHEKTVLNIIDKRAIAQKIETLLSGEKLVSPEPSPLRINKIKSGNTIQQLLTSNLQSLDMGISWDIINWKDTKEVTEVMNKVIDFLENQD